MSEALGGCNGGRRRFLKTAAASGAVLASAPAGFGAPPEAEKAVDVPLVTLGKTGQKVTKLGMGTSWDLSPSFVRAAILAGVRYIDTAEGYNNTLVEKTLGEALEAGGFRKQVYLVTKTSQYRRAHGEAAARVFGEHLTGSMERLKTDYIDSYYMHGMEGSQIPLLKDSGVKAAFENLKKAGKIRFAGLSCHDAMLPEILEAAADAGWIDQIMFQYNFRWARRNRTPDQQAAWHDKLQRAVDKVAKANIGLVAMKTQGGAESFPDKIKQLGEKGFKKEVAAVKSVWMDGRIQVVVSEMTTRSDLRENVAASKEPLTAKEAALLEEHHRLTMNLYCHGCGHLCETAAKGVPVSTVLRYLRYYTAYGKRQQARALYQALPAEARNLAAADLAAAEAACPYGLPVAQLVQLADRRLG